MNGHHVKVGMRVRVHVPRGESSITGRVGTVTQRGPAILGSMPSWAMVQLDDTDETPYAVATEHLVLLEEKLS